MSAVKLVSTKEMGREEWLQWRNRGIGSSDAPVAVGMSRYKSPLELWMEKTGRKIQEDISNKDAVFWGTTLEPIVANVYAERTGKKVRRVNSVLQPLLPAHLFRRYQFHCTHDDLQMLKSLFRISRKRLSRLDIPHEFVNNRAIIRPPALVPPSRLFP